MKEQVGILNEVGDLGLGFDPLSPKDQEILKEQQDGYVIGGSRKKGNDKDEEK